MKTTIIYDHPYDKSLNKEILNRVIKKLKHEQKDYEVIDFHQIGFNPITNVKELSLFNQGLTTREDVKKYQKLLKESDELIFIFPIWWNNMPANTKGWIDLVFKSGFAYTFEHGYWEPLLTHIKKATFYTTSGQTTKEIVEKKGNPIDSVLIKGVMNEVGIMDCNWINFERMGIVTQEEIEKKLNKISE